MRWLAVKLTSLLLRNVVLCWLAPLVTVVQRIWLLLWRAESLQPLPGRFLGPSALWPLRCRRLWCCRQVCSTDNGLQISAMLHAWLKMWYRLKGLQALLSGMSWL